MGLADLLSELDPRPGVRGRQFERICAWYLSNAPEYRERIRQVWLWSEWPGAWAADAGIDLVAEERGGRMWAVQAKAYDPSYAIKKADIDSFLSESSRAQFSYRLLIATTDLLGPTARRTLDSQREPVGYLLRSQLELAQVRWPASPADLRPRRPPPKRPLAHVRDAIRATVTGFGQNDRGQLIMACGTGKTLAGMWIAERLGCVRTLVLVPSLSLLGQTLREWSANASEPFEYLAVCSDETVVGKDELVQHTAELGLPVTTSPAEISSFLRRRGRRVVFATYQSSPQIAKAHQGGTPALDLAIADEAHRCAGRVASEFATILDEKAIRARRRLFMTATPRYYTPRLRREAGLLDVEVASMDDQRVFGPVLHRLTFGEAIERDLLSDYQVVVVGVDDETCRAWVERGELVTRDGTRITDARTLAGQIGLAKTMRKYDLARVISFHGLVRAARRFSTELPDVIAWLPAHERPPGSLWSEHVSGEMSSGHRDRLLLRFRDLLPGERGLLSNARCLSEGVDVPTIDGIAFIDPRHSTIDIIQAVGRAIRKAPDKRVGTIVLPVFLTNEDPEQALGDSTFSNVWEVLKALRAHDEQLGEELDELRRNLGARRGRPRRPGKIKLDVPATCVGGWFADAFNLRLVEHTTVSWEFWFGLLQRFVERERHPLVPAAHTEDGFKLGSWINNQRSIYKRGRLARDRAARLEAVPGWVWDERAARWEESFRLLTRYVENEGHARVPAEHLEDDFRLGRWVIGQRVARTRGTVLPERAARLEALPGWTWHTLEEDWETGFGLLRRFVDRCGHARVPQTSVEDGFKLGVWVAGQRSAQREGKLRLDRVQRLEALPGWVWHARQASWEQGFQQLLRFVEREGHARVQRGYVEDGFELGAWVQSQRTRHDAGRLDPERKWRLESLSGWTWMPHAELWELGFGRLADFVRREGHAVVPRGHVENGFKLDVWVLNQRQRFRRETLSSDRAARLESLPGWRWKPHDASWEAGLRFLRAFVERERHAQVPYSHVEDGFPLGTWVNTQRGAFQTGKLDPARAAVLERLPGWAWGGRDGKWEQAVAAVAQFVEREGHARVPPRHIEGRLKLGSWVWKQRDAYRAGTLSPERKAQLEAIPGWVWEPRQSDWERGFSSLARYVEREGHALVPQDHIEDDFRLGGWVATQRQRYRSGKLDPVRAAQLAALPGWAWNPYEVSWELGFQHLAQFVKRERHASVPVQHFESDFALGRWVQKQRQAFKQGRLVKERAQRLERLPGWVWDARSERDPSPGRDLAR